MKYDDHNLKFISTMTGEFNEAYKIVRSIMRLPNDRLIATGQLSLVIGDIYETIEEILHHAE